MGSGPKNLKLNPERWTAHAIALHAAKGNHQ
jgi:hypothetical protein